MSLPRVEMTPPLGFDPQLLGTWPELSGRPEFSEGRLWYLPPCGDKQQDTVADAETYASGRTCRNSPTCLVWLRPLMSSSFS